MIRAMPEVDSTNLAFWTGGARDQLMITRCDECGHSIHPPQPMCSHCWSDAVKPYPALGTGTVLARTVNRQQWAPDMKTPFALAIVRLDGEGDVRITAPVLTSDPERVAIGDQVRVTFEEQDGLWFPLFQPVDPVSA